jgi:isopenicillin-N epimerase
MPIDRRGFLVRTGLTFAAGALAGAPFWAADEASEDAEAAPPLGTWRAVRNQFLVDPALVHLGGFLLASHPRTVRTAIETHRRGLDRNPVDYLHERGPLLEAAVLRAAARYLGARPADIALTDSTTMGLGLLYNGLDVRAGQELLTTEHDFFATHASLELKAARTGATVRYVRLYARSEVASEDEIVSSLMAGVTRRTRVVAITWVHSSTGVKLPIRAIAAALAEANAGRDEADRALLCVDGVHGLGVENLTVSDLACDFLVSGTHKWLFGPRGTGLVWGRPDAWPAVTPTIPSFTSDGTPGSEMTPGGFHSFEHRWALAQAFRFHEQVGKARIEARIHALNRRLKDGLAGMPHVTLHTPRADALSAGLVCFTVRRLDPGRVVSRLRARGIVATQTPYDPSYARLGAGLLNTQAEVARTLREIRALA